MKALDPHGVTVVSWGTALFALATVACAWWMPTLTSTGRGWWFATCLVGLGIGLIALSLLLLRRHRHQTTAVTAETATDSADQG